MKPFWLLAIERSPWCPLSLYSCQRPNFCIILCSMSPTFIPLFDSSCACFMLTGKIRLHISLHYIFYKSSYHTYYRKWSCLPWFFYIQHITAKITNFMKIFVITYVFIFYCITFALHLRTLYPSTHQQVCLSLTSTNLKLENIQKITWKVN